MPEVSLQPMSEASYERWREQIWVLYLEELIRAGSSPEAAKEDVERNLKATMPNGKLAEGNFVFDVVHGNETIGAVWLWNDHNDWFIYDIDVTEEKRGQGLGRATMRAIEQHVKANGGDSIKLSVFGFNTVAKNLYDSEGYEVTRYAMKKTLS